MTVMSVDFIFLYGFIGNGHLGPASAREVQAETIWSMIT